MTGKNNGADLRLLGIGALGGLVVAGVGILRQDSAVDTLPDNVVARVNDVMITRDVLDRAAGRTSGDSETLVQRLVDDELLIQRGVELGMTRSDLAVRQAIIDSLIASVTAEADAASPTEQALAEYLADNPERFSYIAGVAAEAWQTDDESAARDFIAALRAGDSNPAVKGVEQMPDLPPGLMSLEILGNYVGPGIAAATAEMPEGSSAVFARRGRWLVIRITAKESATMTELSAIQNRVLIDYRRNLADQALRDYIESLRQRADVLVSLP